ncbi:SIS domain-containing protein [Endothiovibrio diazotrophicus]
MTSVAHLLDSSPAKRGKPRESGRYDGHLNGLLELFRNASATDERGMAYSVDGALDWIIDEVAAVHSRRCKVMVIGNGGSAAIASHLAIDFTRNGGVAAMAFNDGASLTCMGNDLGFERVFAEQIELHGRKGDLLVAISSSGASMNILEGVSAARSAGCSVVTFSGFAPDNPLRGSGDMNLYVPSPLYGSVEVAHQMLCHAVIDFAGRWG